MKISEFLTRERVPHELIRHRRTSRAAEVAEECQVPACRVAKTVLLRADGGYTYLLAVLPADRQIDLDRLSKLFGGSDLRLATERDLAAHCPECELGALPPFGSHYGMTTVLDHSLTKVEEIVFETDSHEEAARLRVEDFLRLEEPIVTEFATE